jgi:hypothetical protein
MNDFKKKEDSIPSCERYRRVIYRYYKGVGSGYRDRETSGVKVIGSHHQLKSHFWFNMELCLLATAHNHNPDFQ